MVELAETRLVVLGDVVERIVRADPRKLAVSTFSYVDLGSVDQRRKIIDSEKSVATSEAPSRARQVLKSKDVLVSTVRPNLNGVARVPGRLDGSIASTGFCVLRPRAGQLDPNYLFHWVQSPAFVDGMVRKASGASYPAVSDKIVLASYIPLPPLEEQRRIAAVLDRADELRTKRRQALAHLDALTQSIFHSMFGNVDQRYISVGDACSLITDGTHQTPSYSGAGVKFLSAKNVTSGRIDWTSVKFIPHELHAQLHKRLAPRRGDVLLAKNGTTGVCAVVDTDEVFDIYVSLALLRPAEGFNSCFLHAAINSPESKRQFNGHLKGIGVSNLHLKDIRATKIPAPELALQQAFARRISAVERTKDIHRAQLTEVDALIASLQHRAFSGQL